MDLKQFKVKSETEDSYHMEHPSGRVFNVMKKELAPKAHEQIKKLCMGGYADGGDVAQDPMSVLAEANDKDTGATLAPTPGSEFAAEAAEKAAVPDVSNGTTVAANDNQIAQVPVNNLVPTQPQQTDPLLQGSQSQDALFSKEQQDVANLGKGLDQNTAQQQKAYQDLINQQAKIKSPQDIENEYKAKDDALTNHYLNNNIDPNRYVNNMSTGSKILSGIAMAIGGGGAAIAGQTPMAAQVIQDAIKRDIDTQVNSQEKSMNLWKMNREQLHDDQSANLATQNQMLAGVQAKIAMTAANTQNLQSKFQLTQLSNDIAQKQIENRRMLGLLSQGQGGGSSGANPLNLVPSLVPPAQQKDAIKEIGQAQAANQNESQMMNLFDEAAKQARPVSGGFSDTSIMNAIPGYETPATKSLKLLADPLIHDNEGRINELEQRHLASILPQFGDSDSTVAQKKAALQDFITHKKSAPTAATYGINVNNFRSTTSDPIAKLPAQQQQWYQWAKANPNDPRAQALFKKLGVQ